MEGLMIIWLDKFKVQSSKFKVGLIRIRIVNHDKKSSTLPELWVGQQPMGNGCIIAYPQAEG
jgi:hypothetical protein